MNGQKVGQRRVTGQTVRTVQPKRKKPHYVRNTLLGLLFAGLLAVVAAFAAFLIAYATTELPKPSQFARSQVTSVYYGDGETQIGKFAEVNREIINTTELPKHIGNAVVASEDRTFWTNSGVDLTGIVRAFWNNVRGGQLQGASTLSQQYVERYYTGEQTNTGNIVQRYWAKAQESIMALKINRVQDKDEILGNYLNTIYFGRSSYGIEAAAKAYFAKPAHDMDYSEAAMLAGIIPAPSAYDPAVDSDMATKRWNRVLDFMQEDGYITPKQRSEAVFPTVIPPSQNVVDFGGVNGYLMFQVRQELKDLAGLTEEEIDTMGLKIITTLDKEKQQLMMETVAKMPQSPEPGFRVGMISTDPKTGEIIAEYPGADYLKTQVNQVTQSHFQAGSTFKPFGLVAGLEQGITLHKTFNASSPVTIQGVPIQNYGNYSYGTVSMSRATALSLNVPYVRLNAQVGPALTKEVAIRMGYPDDTPGLDDTLTNVLGSASPTALDIATAYGTFANAGERQVTHLIRQVTDSTGDIVYMPSFRGNQVVERNVALSAVSALEGVFRSGGTAAKATIGRPAAGKTGSSSDNKSAVFAGFVPQMVTVVGMYQGGPNGEEQRITPFGGEREITGSTWPAWLWKQYMQKAVKDLPVERFQTPERVAKVEVTRSEEPSPSETDEETSPTENRATNLPQSPAPRPSQNQEQSPRPSATQPSPRPSATQTPQPTGSASPTPKPSSSKTPTATPEPTEEEESSS